MSAEDLTAVVRLATQRRIWVISDECYVYLNYAGKNFSVGSLREYRDRMVVVGFIKTNKYGLISSFQMLATRDGSALGSESQSGGDPVAVRDKKLKK